jgi:UDP-N-acetylmuramyl tripeptide synthase
MSKEKKWQWDRTRIILKNPNDEDVVLTSEDLNDETMNCIFSDIEEYVHKEGGKLE